jgi:hypothetical protein
VHHEKVGVISTATRVHFCSEGSRALLRRGLTLISEARKYLVSVVTVKPRAPEHPFDLDLRLEFLIKSRSFRLRLRALSIPNLVQEAIVVGVGGCVCWDVFCE